MSPENAQGQGQCKQDIQPCFPPVPLQTHYPHLRQIKECIGNLGDHRRQEDPSDVAADIGRMGKPLGNAVNKYGSRQAADIH